MNRFATLASPSLFAAALSLATLLLLGTSGCALEKRLVRRLGDALAASGDAFASDDDPELVRAAAPFSLKLIESLLAEDPDHPLLLLTATSGFTSYSYAFIEQEADVATHQDLRQAEALRERARRLYARACDYGLRALAIATDDPRKDTAAALRTDPQALLASLTASDVPVLYWTAAAWGRWISLSKDEPERVADQVCVEALIDRALALDEAFGEGAIHTFLISYEMARQGASGAPGVRARAHFARAMELAGNRQVAPLVALAEAVAVQEQDAALFRNLLEQALAVDPDAHPPTRLENLVLMRRARWLLSRGEDLFVEPEPLLESDDNR